jgi:DNA (cytosine-5)-methyltransferase 1
MDSQQRPIGVDLFAGAGGMTLGFEQAGFDVLAAVELDPIHCATHEFNFPLWSILCKSVVDTTGTEIRCRSAIGNQDIDVVFGGSPCQGFSLIGRRALDDPRNALVFHFLRLVLELQPKYFVFENVPGLTVGKHQKLLLEMIEEFNSNGYLVETNYKVLNAANYGVPQDRARLFLLGCRKGLSLPKYPQPITKPTRDIIHKASLLKREIAGGIIPPATLSSLGGGRETPPLKTPQLSATLSDLPGSPTVWDAIADLPEVELYPELLVRDWAIADYGKPSNYSARLRGILPGEDDNEYERQFERGILTSSRRTKHTSECIARFSDTNPGQIEPISRFYKLSTQGICNTLRAGTASNRGAFTSPRPIHPSSPRCITVREAARLHSYPDWFRFHVTKWHGFRQIGNSVPPLLAKAVAAEIIRALRVEIVKPKDKFPLKDEKLLQLNMSQAAQIYGVPANVIEPRTRQTKKKG